MGCQENQRDQWGLMRIRYYWWLMRPMENYETQRDYWRYMIRETTGYSWDQRGKLMRNSETPNGDQWGIMRLRETNGDSLLRERLRKTMETNGDQLELLRIRETTGDSWDQWGLMRLRETTGLVTHETSWESGDQWGLTRLRETTGDSWDQWGLMETQTQRLLESHHTNVDSSDLERPMGSWDSESETTGNSWD